MILLPSCQAATAAMSARHSCGFTGHVKKKCCISASVQKDKADELLGHSRLFLILNMHSNTVFWQLNRGAGANTRWGSGRLRKAQHERRHLADERWRCWKIQVMQTVAPAVMPQDVGPPRRTCTWNEKGNIIPVSFTRKKVIAHFELRELKTGENIDR